MLYKYVFVKVNIADDYFDLGGRQMKRTDMIYLQILYDINVGECICRFILTLG